LALRACGAFSTSKLIFSTIKKDLAVFIKRADSGQKNILLPPLKKNVKFFILNLFL
jgi:hypothetical protein